MQVAFIVCLNMYCAYPKTEPGFPTSSIMVFLCSFCWYWWNWWPSLLVFFTFFSYSNIHSRVKSICTLRHFPVYFILNHLFSTHSLKFIPCLILMKFSALNPKINIVASSCNFHKMLLFILFLMTWFKHKVWFFFIKSYYMIIENCDVQNSCFMFYVLIINACK